MILGLPACPYWLVVDDVERERKTVTAKAVALIAQGICPACHDVETGEPYGRKDRVIHEDDRFIVRLDQFPQVPGHTGVMFKPHREDISAVSEAEAGEIMSMCVRVVRGLKAALGVEKVYVVTMSDGPAHLHFQLLPRPNDVDTGPALFALPRTRLDQGRELASQIKAAMTFDHRP